MCVYVCVCALLKESHKLRSCTSHCHNRHSIVVWADIHKTSPEKEIFAVADAQTCIIAYADAPLHRYTTENETNDNTMALYYGVKASNVWPDFIRNLFAA